jgi:hypothetical protein
MGVLIFPCPSFGACQCHYGSIGTKRCLASRRINRQQSTNGQTYRHTQGNALSCTEPVCLIHSGITRHLIVGNAQQELPHRCASCKNSASSRANTGSVPPTATRSCMPPSAFLQPVPFAEWLLRPNCEKGVGDCRQRGMYLSLGTSSAANNEMLDAVLNHRGSCVLGMIVTSRPCDHQVGLIL